MEKFNFKRTFINGLFLALPLLAILYLGLKIVRIIKKLIAPLANQFGIQHLLGELTLTIFALLILLAVFFILGVMLHAKLLNSLNKQVEAIAYKLVPQLYKFKAIAMDLDEDEFDDVKGWKPVLLQEGESWVPAYITEASDEWLTVFMPEAPEYKSGPVKLIDASTAKYKPVKGLKLRSVVHHYGQGMIDEMKK